MSRIGITSFVVAIASHAALAAEPGSAKLPEPARVRVDFNTHIKPLLQSQCVKCHARGKFKGGLSLETREALLKGGEEGPAAVPGKSAESLLIELVAGLEPDRRMPDKGPPLTTEQVALLRAWIDQGLIWPEGFSFGFHQAALAPRKPEVPSVSGKVALDQPIDRFVARAVAGANAPFDWSPVPDRVFVRRVYLDLIGLPPTPEQREAFEKDTRPDKDERLVAQLLDDRRAYADHWLTFWNDALRNAYRGTGFIDGGRKTITPWLYQALYENKPYDRFVHELISPVPGSEGFTKGIVWRGVVNASQAPPVQAAQNVAQVFLGTNLKCASCHDSFVNHWKLTDAYALASVFAEGPLELHRCDKPTGKASTIGFIYRDLGEIDASAPRAKRMAQLADIVVKPEDGRFARTIVNRLWAQLMGRGIIEPLDDMDQPAWSQDLLDWLATDLVAHKYDLKHTLATICNSRSYRLPAAGMSEPSARGSYQFQGPQTKRLSAEQFADAVSALTGVWPRGTQDMVTVDGRGQGGQLAAVRAAVAASASEKEGSKPAVAHVDAQWVWSHADASKDLGGRILLRKTLRLDKVPERALIAATCDNELVLYVNGRQVAQSTEWTQPTAAEITELLKAGENIIAVEATNWPDAENKRGTQHQGPNPAAFIAWVGGFQKGKLAWSEGSDASWLWTKKAKGNWKAPSFDTSGWSHAVELPHADGIYGGRGGVLAPVIDRMLQGSESTPVRAALVFDDPLLSTLGRTSREQVVTRRDSLATTLQALELTNGATLDEKLKQGAQLWLDRYGKDPDALIQRLFLTALGRAPVPDELATARELAGTPPSRDGVQDLLWTLTMLPEFQLID